MGDEVLIKASIDTLSQAACLHLVHLKFFLFFFWQSFSLCVCVLWFPLPPSPFSVPLFSHGDR